MDTIGAEGAHQIHGEERKPAEDEPANDDAKSLRCLRLHSKFFHLQQFDTSIITMFLLRSRNLTLDLLQRNRNCSKSFHSDNNFDTAIVTLISFVFLEFCFVNLS